MYWSEIGGEPQIEQAGMDGSSRKILLSQGLGWPTSIVLDQLSWKIFWSDDKFHCIGSANLDGTGISVSVLLVIGLCEMSCALCKTHPRNLTISHNESRSPISTLYPQSHCEASGVPCTLLQVL